MRTLSRCGGRGIPFFFKSFVAGWKKQSAVRVSRLPTFAFFGLRRNAQYLADGTFCGGPFLGLQSKVSRCVAIPALPAVREWRRQAGVSCAAKSPASFLLCKKDCSAWVLPSIAVLLSIKSSYLPVSRKFARRATVSVETSAAAAVSLCVPPMKKRLAKPAGLAELQTKMHLNYAQSEAERI